MSNVKYIRTVVFVEYPALMVVWNNVSNGVIICTCLNRFKNMYNKQSKEIRKKRISDELVECNSKIIIDISLLWKIKNCTRNQFETRYNEWINGENITRVNEEERN